MLEVPKGCDEMSFGYVDDMALVAVASDFRQAHQRLKQMIVWPGGAVEWSGTHNSRFEATKSTLLDFTWSKSKPRAPMTLQGVTLALQVTHKFLGVLLDQELQWNHQSSAAIAKPQNG